MRNRYILDGYNVIGKIPRLSRILDTEGLEQSREALASMLAAIMHERRDCDFMIVFDGCSGDIVHDSRTRIRGIECHFTRTGEEADDYIGHMLGRMKDKRGVAVISEDGKVANKCKVHSVGILHPSALFMTTARQPSASTPGSKVISQKTAEDITKWYKEKLG